MHVGFCMNHWRKGGNWKKGGGGKSRTVERLGNRRNEGGGGEELMVRDYIYGFSLTQKQERL